MTNSKQSIIGSFIFRNEGDGIISAKWFNNLMDYPMGESATLIDPTKIAAEFSGEYYSTWLENGSPKTATLEISIKNGSKYNLIWKKGNKKVFYGEAMLYNGLLFGYYWDSEASIVLNIKKV